MIKKAIENKSEYFYFVFRVLIGLVFLLHGIQKLPGMISGKTAIFSMFWFAGVIELVAGVFLILGLFVTYTTIVAGIEMLYAFFVVHVAQGSINPLINKGEAALLLFAAFLVLMSHGARKWSLDNLISRK